MNARTLPCDCAAGQGRQCDACTHASRTALASFAGWLMLVLAAAGAFAVVTLGRQALAPEHAPAAFGMGLLFVAIGGVRIGLALGRWRQARRESDHSEAGDTHAGFVNTEVLPRAAARAACASQMPTRRVRAGHPPPLRYSYDGRKKTGTV